MTKFHWSHYSLSTEEHREKSKQAVEQRALASYCRMLDALRKELTSAMLVFEHEAHAIKVIGDSYGFLTCSVRDRATNALLHTVRFRKAPKLGVVYQFRDAGRMNLLAFLPAKLAEITVPPIADA